MIITAPSRRDTARDPRINHLTSVTPAPLAARKKQPPSIPEKKDPETTRKKVISYIKQNKIDLFTIALFTGITATAIVLTPLGIVSLPVGIIWAFVTGSPVVGGSLKIIREFKRTSPADYYGRIDPKHTKTKKRDKKPKLKKKNKASEPTQPVQQQPTTRPEGLPAVIKNAFS